METTQKKGHKIHHRARKNKQKEFEIFALFLAQTILERQETFGCYTEIEFGKQFKINRHTLTVWKQDEHLWELRDKSLIMLKQFTVQVLEGIRNRATIQGDANAAKVWLQYVEKWIPNEKQEIEITPTHVDIFE